MRKSRYRTLILVLQALLIVLFLLLLVLNSPTGGRAAGSRLLSSGQPGHWDLIFADEFSGQSLDANKWTTCYWWAEDGCNIASNDALEWYQPENVSVEDGKLVLTALRKDVLTTDGRVFDYTSGMVTSGRDTSEIEVPIRFAFTYGFVEIRAKVPSGRGMWPALWLLPARQESKPEIDIMEILGHQTNEVKLNFHYRNSAGESEQSSGSWTGTEDLSLDWHTYAVRWSPEEIVWYIDGIERRRYTETERIPAEPMYLIMNLAVGGNYPGPVGESTQFPSRFEIDYVRVWQPAGNVLLSPLADTYTNAADPDQNFAGDRGMAVSGTPEQAAFLKYDLSQISGKKITAAWLRVKTTADPQAGSTAVQTVHLVTGSQWEEKGLTHNNRPPIDPQVLGQISNTAPNISYDIPLDPALIQPHVGEMLSLALQSSSQDQMFIYSRRFQTIYPRLMIEIEEPSEQTGILGLFQRLWK